METNSNQPYRCYAVIRDRGLLAEFDTRAKAEAFARDFPGSMVTLMVIPL